MAGVYKRKSDRARGKAGKYTAWWVDESGKRRVKAAFTDRAKSLELANFLDAEARRVREGLAEPGEARRREASRRTLADHVADYKADLLARGDKPKHASEAASSIARTLALASIRSLGDIAPDRVRLAMGRLRELGRAPRTCNLALRVFKGFVGWLEATDRIARVPKGLARLEPFNEAADRRVRRRALTPAEVDRLLSATEAAPRRRAFYHGPTLFLTGPERAALYRLALGTGFRAEEIRTLTPERFALDGESPTITVLACYSKNGKEAVQPITRELAALLRPFVADKPPGKPVFYLPEKVAGMLHRDLEAAGIPARDASGRIVDFHSLRHTYITHLVARGLSLKVVQKLARHSTITLTLDRYTHVDAEDIRKALEG